MANVFGYSATHAAPITPYQSQLEVAEVSQAEVVVASPRGSEHPTSDRSTTASTIDPLEASFGLDTVTVWPDTDCEGEPEVKTFEELWPLATRRRQAPHSPAARPRASEVDAVRAVPNVPEGAEVTTLVVRNLPDVVTQQEFLNEVNKSGFAGAYDYAYLPCSRDSGRGTGHGYVNFRTTEFAAAFRAAWHGSTRLGVSAVGKALNVAASSVQGFRANADKWPSARMRRVKNANFLPFISYDTVRQAELGRQGDDVTTLVVQNMPDMITQQEFLDEVNKSGFAGSYDFAYLPRSRDSGRGSGRAFVNFKTPELAAAFRVAWHNSARLGMSPTAKALNVAPSSVQGFRANTVKWTPAQMAKVKNANFLPFVFWN